jgi:hypothetical protein
MCLQKIRHCQVDSFTRFFWCGGGGYFASFILSLFHIIAGCHRLHPSTVRWDTSQQLLSNKFTPLAAIPRIE